MQTEFAEISVKGKPVRVPALAVDGLKIVVLGRFPRIARLHEEEWVESQKVTDPESVISKLRKASPRPDVFTFAQPLSHPERQHPYHAEWEDVAAVPITTYSEWWDQLPQEARKNVRRAEKRGVVVKLAAFDDALVRGIKSIYDESPIRQGRPFWHYGKDLETVRRENGTFLEHSEFVAAYFEGELIGFIKIVYVGKVARIMQIISKNAHFDKRPPNILLAKAMEACCQKGMSHFVYGQYFYGNKGHTPITEFKRRNGFQRIVFPRYYVGVTLRGRLAIALRLHLGMKNLIPKRVLGILLEARSRLNRKNAGIPETTSDSRKADPGKAKVAAEKGSQAESQNQE
jgi:hypothetical protein